MTDTPRKGRKPLRPSGPMGRYLLSLDEDSMAVARMIGSGNASLGVRMALAAMPIPEKDISTIPASDPQMP